MEPALVLVLELVGDDVVLQEFLSLLVIADSIFGPDEAPEFQLSLDKVSVSGS